MAPRVGGDSVIDAPEKPFRVVYLPYESVWTNVGPLPFVNSDWVESIAEVIYQLPERNGHADGDL